MNLRSIVTGVPISLLGAFLGLYTGMTIGGNFIPPAGLEFAHLAGYEGAGLLGAILGAALASGLWIWKQTKGTSNHPYVLTLWATTTILVLILVHVSGPTGTPLVWGMIFLPGLSPISLLFKHRTPPSETVEKTDIA